MLKCDYPGCIKEFEAPKSLSAHKAWHTRKRSRLADNLFMPAPSPVSKVDLDLSPEGHLKISIKKENLTKEEFEVRL